MKIIIKKKCNNSFSGLKSVEILDDGRRVDAMKLHDKTYLKSSQ